jgi:hypothetical protein
MRELLVLALPDILAFTSKGAQWRYFCAVPAASIKEYLEAWLLLHVHQDVIYLYFNRDLVPRVRLHEGSEPQAVYHSCCMPHQLLTVTKEQG